MPSTGRSNSCRGRILGTRGRWRAGPEPLVLRADARPVYNDLAARTNGEPPEVRARVPAPAGDHQDRARQGGDIFALEPDIACKGAQKTFVSFAEQIVKEWDDEARRATYGDEWFKAAVGRVILFRTAEEVVSNAAWYEGGYRRRATPARASPSRQDGERRRHARLHQDLGAPVSGSVLERQLERIAEIMARTLRHPPSAGQNVTEWAKQQAGRAQALSPWLSRRWTSSTIWVVGEERRSGRREASVGRVDSGFAAVVAVMGMSRDHWRELQEFCVAKRMLIPGEERHFFPVKQIPMKAPSELQARCLLAIRTRLNGSAGGPTLEHAHAGMNRRPRHQLDQGLAFPPARG